MRPGYFEKGVPVLGHGPKDGAVASQGFLEIALVKGQIAVQLQQLGPRGEQLQSFFQDFGRPGVIVLSQSHVRENKNRPKIPRGQPPRFLQIIRGERKTVKGQIQNSQPQGAGGVLREFFVENPALLLGVLQGAEFQLGFNQKFPKELLPIPRPCPVGQGAAGDERGVGGFASVQRPLGPGPRG